MMTTTIRVLAIGVMLVLWGRGAMAEERHQHGGHEMHKEHEMQKAHEMDETQDMHKGHDMQGNQIKDEGHGMHEGHGKADDEPAQADHAGHGQHGAQKTPGLIRVVSPETGYHVVLGKKNPVPELSHEMATDEQGRAVKVFRLTVKDVKFEIYPGKFIQGWGFNGQIPGPTIRVKQGDRIRILLENDTEEGHTVHIHGQRKPMAMDGVPYLGQKQVEWGDSYAYEFEVNYPGTHWYHCHVDSGHHVDMGMYGAFIVDPAEETIRYDREYLLILDEWPTGHVHIHGDAMPMKGHEGHGVVTRHEGEARHEHEGEGPPKRDWYPETYNPYQPVHDGFSINGRAFPFTEPLDVREGERVRIRMINVGYESHFMHPHAHKMTVVTRDGSPVDEPARIDVVEVGPGQRVDVILVADNPGIWPFHCHDLLCVANDRIYPGGMLTFIRYIE